MATRPDPAPLDGRTVLVVGAGRSGRAALALAAARGARTRIASRGPVEDWFTGGLREPDPPPEAHREDAPDPSRALDGADLLVLSPGVPPDRPLVRAARRRGVEAVGETELAWRLMAAAGGPLPHVTAVTGTNGKSTTATMLAELLALDGRDVRLGGNIGAPLSELVLAGAGRGGHLVLELSSFQLEGTAEFRADLALLLNVRDHHGERHATKEDYARAKARVALNMGADGTLVHADDPAVAAALGDGPCRRVPVGGGAGDVRRRLAGFDLSRVRVPGLHNLLNFAFVLEASRVLGVAPRRFQELLDGFRGLPHRFERVESPLAPLVVNDSKSTGLHAVEAALGSLPDHRGRVTLVMGGRPRGRGDAPGPALVRLIGRACREVLVQGESAALLQDALAGGPAPVRGCRDLAHAAAVLRERAPHDAVLFSPGFPSFDQFPDYAARGDAFKKLVTGRRP